MKHICDINRQFQVGTNEHKTDNDGLVGCGSGSRSFKVTVRGAECLDTWRETAESKLSTTTETDNSAGGLEQTTKPRQRQVWQHNGMNGRKGFNEMEEHVFGTTESQTSQDYTEWTDTDWMTTGPDRDGEAGWQSGSERVDGGATKLVTTFGAQIGIRSS